VELNSLRNTLHAKGVALVCPACGMGHVGGVMNVDLGASFLGVYCAHCGHLRLFHVETLEAPED